MPTHGHAETIDGFGLSDEFGLFVTFWDDLWQIYAILDHPTYLVNPINSSLLQL